MADGTWSLAEAKAKFSEVVEKARRDGPQHVTRNGKPAVVVVTEEEWDRKSRGSARSFVEALLDPAAGVLSREEVDTLFGRDREIGKPFKL